MMHYAIVTHCPRCIVCYVALLFLLRSLSHSWGSCQPTDWLDHYTAVIVIDVMFEEMILVAYVFVSL